METVLQILLWCPRCWRGIGYGMFTICGCLALLGLRLISRADRVERKTGVVIDLAKAFDALPLPIPTSPEGVALAAFGATVGAILALSGKWAQKFQ